MQQNLRLWDSFINIIIQMQSHRFTAIHSFHCIVYLILSMSSCAVFFLFLTVVKQHWAVATLMQRTEDFYLCHLCCILPCLCINCPKFHSCCSSLLLNAFYSLCLCLLQAITLQHCVVALLHDFYLQALCYLQTRCSCFALTQTFTSGQFFNSIT